MYSKKFMEHFLNPKNNGKIKNYDFCGKAIHDVDSDEVVVYIKLNDDFVENMSYQVKGCPRVIAASSALSVLVKGKKLRDVLKISEDDIRKELDFYDEKFACISTPLKALKEAIRSVQNANTCNQ